MLKNKIKKLLKQLSENHPLQKFIDRFLSDHRASKVRIFLVGGCVRDALMNRKSHDFDLVVVGLDRKKLGAYLDRQPGKSVDITSRNFGVFKFIPAGASDPVDIALPRQDIYSHYGRGHKNVNVKIDNVDIKEDLSRRDFTVNAMAVDLATGQLLDSFNGVSDIQHKTIRAVGYPQQRLVDEDPARIMRAIRFAATLNFAIDPATWRCIKNNHAEIIRQFTPESTAKDPRPQPIERVSMEIIAAEFIKGFDRQPARMIELLDESGLYRSILSPDLVKIWDGLKTTDQPANFHYEGNVWQHTLLALRNIKKVKENELGLLKTTDINLKLAVFFHDWGKVTTVKILPDGQYTYYNHPIESAKMARRFIKHLKLTSPFPRHHPLAVNEDLVAFLAHYHMFPNNTPAHELRDRTVIKYYLEKKRIGQKLLQIGYVDALSSIKSHGPQDFSGIIRSLKKINEVSARLRDLKQLKKIYPLTGKIIKKIIAGLSKDNKIDQSIRRQMNAMVTNPKGSPKIGELKELILEDALANPVNYQDKNKKISSARELIINFFYS